MSDNNYRASFLVSQSAKQAFDAIVDPRRWWSENIEGDTTTQGAVFYYHYRDVHRATFKITELVPGEKVVWLVLHNDFNFVKDRTEWTGTELVFEIGKRGDETEVRFTHVGLVPEYECHDVCTDAWGTYIKHSLFGLITLANDAIMSMPPQVEWFAGPEAIARFLARARQRAPWEYRFVPLRANGAPALAVYTRSLTGGPYRAAGITVFVVRGGHVAQVTRFVMPSLFPLFGLADALPEDAAP